MSSKRAKGKTTKKRPQRATSNVFAMFDQSQIQEFKEAFNMIDQNRDGFVDKEDLHDMLASLGKDKIELARQKSWPWPLMTQFPFNGLHFIFFSLKYYTKY